MNKYLFSLFVILSLNSFSQETTSLPLLDKFNDYLSGGELDLVNHNDSLLFVIQRIASDVEITRFDEEYKEIDKFKSNDSPLRNHKILASGSHRNSILFLLSGGIFKNRFSLVTYDFQNQKFQEAIQLEKFKNEDFLRAFYNEEKIHILTVSLNSQELFIYTISENGLTTKNGYDFSTYKFRAPGFSDEKLKYLFYQRGISPIENSEIDSFLEASSKYKSYRFNNELWLTFDQDPEITRLIKFDLKDGKMELQDIPKPISTEGKIKESNSFILDKSIYQLAINKSEMILEIKDLESDLLKYRYSVKADEEIKIKNSEVKLRGAAYVKERLLENTSQFLRKVIGSESAILVRKINDTLQMRIGANRGLAVGAANPGGYIFNGVTLSYYYTNPLPKSELSGAGSRWVSFSSRFDLDFNHLESESLPDLYDKIKMFKESNDLKEDSTEGLTKFGEDYIYYYVYKKLVKLAKF